MCVMESKGGDPFIPVFCSCILFKRSFIGYVHPSHPSINQVRSVEADVNYQIMTTSETEQIDD